MATRTRRSRSTGSTARGVSRMTSDRTAAWLAVTGTRDAKVAAAGDRCECIGPCGREHRREHDGRCHVIDGPAHRLVVAPAAPAVAWTVAARLPGDALAVWCPGCLTEAERAARRDRTAAHAARQDDLFTTGAAADGADGTDGTGETGDDRDRDDALSGWCA